MMNSHWLNNELASLKRAEILQEVQKENRWRTEGRVGEGSGVRRVSLQRLRVSLQRLGLW